MRSLIAALAVFSGEVLAHPDAEVHAHGIGAEHVLLFAVIVGLLAFAARK
jgi:hypothetical protein